MGTILRLKNSEQAKYFLSKFENKIEIRDEENSRKTT